jgi:hypothetical protein
MMINHVPGDLWCILSVEARIWVASCAVSNFALWCLAYLYLSCYGTLATLLYYAVTQADDGQEQAR